MFVRTKMRKPVSSGLLCVFLALAGTSAQADFLAFSVNEEERQPLPEHLDSIDAKHLVNVEWSRYSGKPTRIGVLPVDNKSGAGVMTIDTQGDKTTITGSGAERVPVGGIEAIVMDTMARTGRFSLVERSVLGEVLGEQDLGDRVAQPSAAKVGNVLGAEYLLQVVITDYEDGTTQTAGGALGVFRKVPLIGGAGIKKKESRIGLNFRLIDANTSEVVYTKQLESMIKETGLVLLGASGGGSVDVGGFFGKYSKTPIGQAVIAGANKGVFDLVREIGANPAKGSVVKVEGDRLWLNLGEGTVAVGDRMELMIRGEELIDPETGISLGSQDTIAGVGTVVEVHEKFSIARAGSLSADIGRGDVATSLEPPPTLDFAQAWVPPAKPKKRK